MTYQQLELWRKVVAAVRRRQERDGPKDMELVRIDTGDGGACRTARSLLQTGLVVEDFPKGENTLGNFYVRLPRLEELTPAGPQPTFGAAYSPSKGVLERGRR